MGTAVIAHSNSAPILEPAKHDFYFVPLLITLFVVLNCFFSLSFRRDARGNASFEQGISEPCGIVPPVGQQLAGTGQGRKQKSGPFVIAHLSFGKEQ